ncbi:hypothetical protein CHCC20495_0167 [Bacillus licheniformis]|nr:hypothetical protein CHCC20495_0167 [Bacillus licheniformis]
MKIVLNYIISHKINTSAFVFLGAENNTVRAYLTLKKQLQAAMM